MDVYWAITYSRDMYIIHACGPNRRDVGLPTNIETWEIKQAFSPSLINIYNVRKLPFNSSIL